MPTWPSAAPAGGGPGNPWFSWRYIHDNAGALLSALEYHAGLTARAVIVALIVALPLAVVAYWIRPLTGPILALSGILYTIPSLALLALVAPAAAAPVTGMGVLLFIEVEALADGAGAFDLAAEDVHLISADGRKVLLKVTPAQVSSVRQ